MAISSLKKMNGGGLLGHAAREKPMSAVAVELTWPDELELPGLLKEEKVKSLFATINSEWSALLRSACQTAAGRALWKKIVGDPLAEILAGEDCLRNLHKKIIDDQIRRSREVSGVIIAVRTLWFDSKLTSAVDNFGPAQVVLLGAGMDTRAYRMGCLELCSVFEVDFPELLETKEALLRQALGSGEDSRVRLARVAADITEGGWLEKLKRSGFDPEKKTVWVLEGILYYLSSSCAMEVLKLIAGNCVATRSVLLADFMNESCGSLSDSNSFQFLCDWPDLLLPSLGFAKATVSQIGDPDAHFGLMYDPENLFNRLRRVPRTLRTNPDDGSPCRRLYLVEASG
ncbi:leucine carboxyl methyltransferase [Wolffia australiana]